LLCELHCETKGKIRTLVLLVEDFKALPSMSIDDFEKILKIRIILAARVERAL
jgi:hypothetical protein